MGLHWSSTIRGVGVGVMAVIAVGSCDDSTGPDAGTRDEIVYSAFNHPSGDDLFAVRIDGAHPRQLTSAPGSEFFPAVSPDGGRIAFRSDQGGESEIVVINADGTDERNLTNDLAHDAEPAWAPDGQRLIFSSTRDGGPSELYIVGLDGGGLTRLTNNTIHDMSPHWSPDGTKIAIVRETEPARFDIYVMSSDGTNPVRLTDSRFQEFAPRWSPDGRRIAFIADTVIALQSGGVPQSALAIVDAAGSPRDLLTDFSGAFIQGFTWSRDGARLIFSRSGDLWSLNVGDKSVTRLTDTPAVDERGPSWRRVP